MIIDYDRFNDFLEYEIHFIERNEERMVTMIFPINYTEDQIKKILFEKIPEIKVKLIDEIKYLVQIK
ncbi:hypothetical protein G7081_03930 [Vagococcus coleopterorum]|uniref:Uncharacterized protein n=1 Tax=Vagococcus coleopterorum TaxID=2714946 RepID=A0A6G8AMQ3_9ENTE|nr:hypothetical protein [Vagococcus coleopterorum]QIL46276.1 hypothetical protein G7081_03930 [Vagococcus coleopterorum]